MSGVEWVAAGVSMVGAGLAYLGARHGSRPEEEAVTQSERDEWGRRFATAIDLMAEESERRRAMGRALLEALLASDLAQPNDLQLAQGLLRAAVLGGIPASELGGIPAEEFGPRSTGGRFTAPTVDDLDVIEDDGDGSPAELEVRDE
jgi:hypothetical protein